jgi:hypothetical protein
VNDHRTGLNGRIGLFITQRVGSMWAAYLFAALALISLPSALSSGSSIVIVSWVAQTFLQLVLLPIIIVGQNIQAAASDTRAEETYKDAEAVLHECVQIQAHLGAQDRFQQMELAELKDLVTGMQRRLAGETSASGLAD